jgi:hypothetical protein
LERKLEAELAAYESLRLAYEADRKTLINRFLVRGPNGRDYAKSGNGLVGGTSWILSYDVPVGASQEEANRQRDELADQSARQNKDYVGSVDINRYNHAIAIASSNSIVKDLFTRVALDQLTRGQYSAWAQEGYEALRSRQYDELGCHSNGAMICLAALTNEDVLADRVVLYGPQLTAESVRMWSNIARKKNIKVEMLINQYDSVPAVSLLASLSADRSVENARIAAKPIFRDVEALKAAIHELGPGVLVTTFECPLPSMLSFTSCHDMTSYRRNRNCSAPSLRPLTIVPGTRLPDGSSVREPPPPC